METPAERHTVAISFLEGIFEYEFTPAGHNNPAGEPLYTGIPKRRLVKSPHYNTSVKNMYILHYTLETIQIMKKAVENKHITVS